VFYEKFEICVDTEELAGVLDFSEFQIIAESDTDVYLNGSLNFVKEVEAPWKAKIFTEKFDRNEWHIKALDKKISDFCESIRDEKEPWYFVTSKFEPNECPFAAGVSFLMQFVDQVTISLNSNQAKIKLDYILLETLKTLPPNFVGKWRITMQAEFDDGETVKKDCLRIYFDLAEE
jgi:hypothetical protein